MYPFYYGYQYNFSYESFIKDKKKVSIDLIVFCGVSDGVRTRGHQDHNLVLYQLSYTHLKKTCTFYQKQLFFATLFLFSFQLSLDCHLTFKIDLDPLFDYYPYGNRVHKTN